MKKFYIEVMDTITPDTIVSMQVNAGSAEIAKSYVNSHHFPYMNKDIFERQTIVKEI